MIKQTAILIVVIFSIQSCGITPLLNNKTITKKLPKYEEKFMKIKKEMGLSSFVYFPICIKQESFENVNIIDELKNCKNGIAFLEKFELCQDKYRAHFYDESFHIKYMSMGKTIFPYSNVGMPDSLYIKYIIEKINPKYVFEYMFSSSPYPVYFCYKDNIIIIVLSEDGKNISSYFPLELNNWEWLNLPL